MIKVATLALVLLLVARPASAWSTKEHILLTRLAALRLLEDQATPDGMKAWLRAAAPDLPDLAADRDYLLRARVGVFPRGADGIPFWAVVPDLDALIDSGPADRMKKIEPFGVGERLLHFVDLEMFMPDESRRRYAPDLSNKPALADFPRDMNDPRYLRAGMLPFRVEQVYGKLVDSIAAGRLTDTPGQFPRDEHAAKWAGFLAHYVQDNTQPQHATVDYRSSTYFKDFRSAPNVHADVEYRLVDDEFQDYPALREAFWEALTAALAEVQDPVGTDGDLFEQTLRVSMASYDALPLIGEAAVAAYANAPARGQRPRPSDFDADTFFGFKGNVGGVETTVMQMKARQMALAVKRTERLWTRAWQEGMSMRAQGPVKP
jgi:hypothetical protein